MGKKLVRNVLDLDVMEKQNSDTSWKDVHIDHEKGLTYCGGSEDFLKEIISMYAADDKRAEIQKAVIFDVRSNPGGLGRLQDIDTYGKKYIQNDRSHGAGR